MFFCSWLFGQTRCVAKRAHPNMKQQLDKRAGKRQKRPAASAAIASGITSGVVCLQRTKASHGRCEESPSSPAAAPHTDQISAHPSQRRPGLSHSLAQLRCLVLGRVQKMANNSWPCRGVQRAQQSVPKKWWKSIARLDLIPVRPSLALQLAGEFYSQHLTSLHREDIPPPTAAVSISGSLAHFTGFLSKFPCPDRLRCTQ